MLQTEGTVIAFRGFSGLGDKGDESGTQLWVMVSSEDPKVEEAQGILPRKLWIKGRSPKELGLTVGEVVPLRWEISGNGKARLALAS